MATQSFIHAQQDVLKAAYAACRQAEEALGLEVASNGKKIDPNRTAWDLLYVSAQDLEFRLMSLIKALEDAR